MSASVVVPVLIEASRILVTAVVTRIRTVRAAAHVDTVTVSFPDANLDIPRRIPVSVVGAVVRVTP